MARTLINVPKSAQVGEVVTIKTLISHPMETGFRPGADGRIRPRDIITEFACLYDGETVVAFSITRSRGAVRPRAPGARSSPAASI